MSNASHFLVVGGTGMLAGACTELARAGHTVSVVARNSARLRILRANADTMPGKIVPVAADYSHAEEFQHLLRDVIAHYGAVATAVCWIHSHSPQARIVVADLIGSEPAPPEFFEIVGSAAANPSTIEDSESVELRKRRDIRYHRVILGFKITQTGSRWLTDDEICNGVLGALKSQQTETVVGVVQPWEKRP